MIYKTNSGYGVNFNQIFEKGNFPSASGFSAMSGTRTVSDNVLTFTATDWYGGVYINTGINAVNGHKYLFLYELKTDATTVVNAGYGYGSTYATVGLGAIANSWNYYGSIATVSGTSAYLYIYFLGGSNITPNGNCYARNCMVIDLTQMFGSGNEPTTVAEFREMYSDDYYDYTLSQWQWSKKGKITSYPTPVIENNTTLLPIENHIVGLAHYNNGNTDIIYNYAKRELPVGFVQLDYIESTGTQWIDTGVNFFSTENNRLDMDVGYMDYNTYNQFWGSSYDADTYEAWTYSNNNSFVARYNNQRVENLGYLIPNSRYILSFIRDDNSYKVIINAVEKGSITLTSSYTRDANLHLLHSGTDNSKLKLYVCRVYMNGVLVRNFIPCYRYSDGIEGLYDTVGKQFYTNQGTGRFLRGNIIDGGILNNGN